MPSASKHPIPKDDRQAAIVAAKEGATLQSTLLLALQFEIKEKRIRANEVDPNAMSACCVSYATILNEYLSNTVAAVSPVSFSGKRLATTSASSSRTATYLLLFIRVRAFFLANVVPLF
jgi:hypothetical protein